MKLTLFRNKGAPHAIPNSLVPGSICFDRFSLQSRILFEQPLSNGSLPNMNPPSFGFPLAVRMTKVCYLGDYRQFLSARAAKQIEGPTLPWWAESLGTTSFSELSCFPIRSPTHTLSVCLSVWLLGERYSTQSCQACHALYSSFPKAPMERRSDSTRWKGRRWTTCRSRWVIWGILIVNACCVAKIIMFMLNFFLSLMHIYCGAHTVFSSQIKIIISLKPAEQTA